MVATYEDRPAALARSESHTTAQELEDSTKSHTHAHTHTLAHARTLPVAVRFHKIRRKGQQAP
jgi:hypothetical protein